METLALTQEYQAIVLRDLQDNFVHLGRKSQNESQTRLRGRRLKNQVWDTSLLMQWLRIRLPMQGTWVQALVWEDPTCRGATKPMRHNS